MINDIVLEALNAQLIVGIILYQLMSLRKTGLKRKPGTRMILSGLGMTPEQRSQFFDKF